MIVVNLFAGPGAGKSTIAAGLFSELKWNGINSELVTEFAKDLTWESRDEALKDQIYVFGKQLHRIKRLSGKVDVVITDSPVLLSLVYGENNDKFHELVIQEFDKFCNLNVFVNRTKPYRQVGRKETEAEARFIDSALINILTDRKFIVVRGDRTCIPLIVDEVMSYIV